MGFLYLGQKDAKNAAKEQAKATRDAANMAILDNNMAAKAAADSMQTATAQRIAQQAANELLSKPMESASVDLASDQTVDDGTDLIGRRKSTRSKYQSSGSSKNTGLVV